MNQISTLRSPFELPNLPPTTSRACSRAPLPVRTFADLLVQAEAWPELSYTVREVLKSNIRTAAFIAASARARGDGRTDKLGREADVLSTVPVDVPWLNQHLFTYPAAVHGLTELSYSKSIGGLRRILRRLNLLDPRIPPPLAPETSWSRLLASHGQARYIRLSLHSFACWCYANGVLPSDVTQQTLTEFESYFRTRHLHSNLTGLLRGAEPSSALDRDASV